VLRKKPPKVVRRPVDEFWRVVNGGRPGDLVLRFRSEPNAVAFARTVTAPGKTVLVLNPYLRTVYRSGG
jgi:hypothetical protein